MVFSWDYLNEDSEQKESEDKKIELNVENIYNEIKSIDGIKSISCNECNYGEDKGKVSCIAMAEKGKVAEILAKIKTKFTCFDVKVINISENDSKDEANLSFLIFKKWGANVLLSKLMNMQRDNGMQMPFQPMLPQASLTIVKKDDNI
jgi:hypothetical protein